MSFRLEMLQVARLAPSVLGDSADLVKEFVLARQCPDGGFRGRSEESDLYYTGFAIDALTALQVPLPEASLVPYLRAFGDGESLDFVHLCCLARAWSAMTSEAIDPSILSAIFSRIEGFRAEEGGYSQDVGSALGSAYGCLLAYGGYADHGRKPEDVEGIGRCLNSLVKPEGSWANDTKITMGNSLATGAAITISRNLRFPIPSATKDWLINCFYLRGGFLPFQGAPMPDLLSTAVTLHALDGMQVDLTPFKEPCLDFVDSLWNAEGGFHGYWADDELDIEYTYYGLLALGHLAL